MKFYTKAQGVKLMKTVDLDKKVSYTSYFKATVKWNCGL